MTDLYTLPRVREQLVAGAADESDADDVNDVRRFHDSDDGAPTTDTAADVRLPAVPPPPLETWRPKSPKGRGYAEISRVEDVATLRLTFSHHAMPRPKAAPFFAAIEAAALSASGGIAEVKSWQAAIAELNERRRSVAVLKAELQALDAKRVVLLARGGAGVTEQIRAIDAERASLRAELAEAEALLPTAEEVEGVRRERAEAAVRREHNRVLAQRSQSSRDREAEIMREIADRCAPLLTELLTVNAEGEAIGPLLYQSDRPSVAALMMRLQAEEAATATA
jgi:hypothetical protein